MGPGTLELEGSVPNITRPDAVPEVDAGHSRCLAFEHRVQYADIVVGVPEIGEQRDRTHVVTLAHLPPQIDRDRSVTN
jgi:hypothetical protein